MRLGFAAALAGYFFLACATLAAAQEKKEEEIFKLMKTETIGQLKLDLTEPQVKQALPAQPARGRDVLWGADGRYHQRWTYAKQGMRLSMVSDKRGGPKTLESIECTARCTLKSSRGVGGGSTLADVQKAYAAEFNQEDSKLPETFVAGSIYGGLIFSFKGGKVSAMFLGAAAE